MDARFYNSEDIDIERLASDLVTAYQSQGYKAQQIGNRDQILVQIKKGGDFEAVLGMQAALSITIQRTAGGVLAMLGQQRWVDKAAVGAVGLAAFFFLWPLAVTAGVGAVRQASLGNQALNMVDGLVRQQRPEINFGPIPPSAMVYVQQQWEQLPPSQNAAPYYVPSGQTVVSQPALPSPSRLRCPQCNTPYDPGDTFCSGCGRPLTERKAHCPNCNSELKAGLSFCPKCGVSTFGATSAGRTAIEDSVREVPTYTPLVPPLPQPQTYYVPSQSPDAPTVSSSSGPQAFPETPVYTPPPAPQPNPQPYYTPPTQQERPPTPVYTSPPSQTSPQPYYVPSESASKPPTPAAPPEHLPTQYYTPPPKPEQPPTPLYIPTTPATPPEKPAVEAYVPPVPQEPPVKPQPKVTIIQSAPKQEPPPPKPRPQKQYYIPSDQAQQAANQAQPAQDIGSAPTVISPPVQQAKNGSWGLLTFSDGQQMRLSGERALVGRYDHDLKGVPPEIDLGQMSGADTVSRVHAVLEHLGSSYTLTDLNSTNATRLNNKRLEPDKAMPITTGDTLQFGKVTCTFEKTS